MSFKTRLILSYVVMFIAPIILTIIAAAVISVLNARAVASSYGFDFKGNPVHQFMEKSELAFDDIKKAAESQPDIFLNETYIADLEKNLDYINTGMVVRKDDKIIYSSELLNKMNFNKTLLPSFGTPSKESYQPIKQDSKMMFLRYKDFYFNDNSEGSIFLITDMTPITRSAGRTAIYMGLAILLILITTNGLLTYFVSRSVLRPIETLKNAANHIKEGNLEFEVRRTSNDEIGELCTAFEKMRQKLKESVELQIQYENNRKELISNISHDLKTPVTAIKGYVEGIIDGVADSPDKMDRYIKTIYTKASDLDQLIDELFLFSKLDLNKLTFNFEEVNIKSYLEDCAEEIVLDLEKNNIDLSLDVEAYNSPIVLLDREKLKRAILNIVGNSTKYMDKENGRIDISLTELENEVKIEIRDNGQGIPKEDIPFIFDRFYRADPSRNTATGGSGLGLAIVKRIIEEHEGLVWAESEEGAGTSIFFTLKTIKSR